MIVSYALRWMQLIHPVPHDSLAELEMIQWKYRIQAELTEAPPPQLEPANPAGSTSGGCPLLSGRIRNLTVDRLPPAADGLSPAFVGGVTSWIERALDAEDILLATKLSKMFGLKNRDLLLIELLLHVVESVLPLDELQQRFISISIQSLINLNPIPILISLPISIQFLVNLNPIQFQTQSNPDPNLNPYLNLNLIHFNSISIQS